VTLSPESQSARMSNLTGGVWGQAPPEIEFGVFSFQILQL